MWIGRETLLRFPRQWPTRRRCRWHPIRRFISPSIRRTNSSWPPVHHDSCDCTWLCCKLLKSKRISTFSTHRKYFTYQRLNIDLLSQEWSLYSHGTVLATARHIDSAANSSALFADIANTIDGGVDATDDQKAAALIGCGTAGGSLGVVYNASNPQYNTATYIANNYTPSGLLIKIVWSGAS